MKCQSMPGSGTRPGAPRAALIPPPSPLSHPQLGLPGCVARRARGPERRRAGGRRKRYASGIMSRMPFRGAPQMLPFSLEMRRPALPVPPLTRGTREAGLGARRNDHTGGGVRDHPDPGRETIDRSRSALWRQATARAETAFMPRAPRLRRGTGSSRRAGAAAMERYPEKSMLCGWQCSPAAAPVGGGPACTMACTCKSEEEVPLDTGWRVTLMDNADAGGANPATPAALPYTAGGTGVHTGFETTGLIRRYGMISVGLNARTPGRAVHAASACQSSYACEIWRNEADTYGLHRPGHPAGARGADTTFFPPERVTIPYPQHTMSRSLGTTPS